MAQKYPPPRVVHAIHAAIPTDPSHPLGVVLSLKGDAIGPEPVYAALTVGEALDIGRSLVEITQAILADQKRPWDDDPGRTPYYSRRSSRRGSQRASAGASAPDRPRARRR